MKKVTKTQVKSLAKKQGAVKVWLCPSNCIPNPANPLDIAVLKEFTSEDVLKESFEKFLNTFMYYNCSKDTGKTVHYYIAG